jgi:hypothetical protein
MKANPTCRIGPSRIIICCCWVISVCRVRPMICFCWNQASAAMAASMIT